VAEAKCSFCWVATDDGVEVIADLPSGPASKRSRRYLAIRDGGYLAGKAVNTDYHCFTHHAHMMSTSSEANGVFDKVTTQRELV
jgi:hypothetical protein